MCICLYQWMLGVIFFRNFPWWKLNKWCWSFKKVERGSSLQFDFISIWLYYFYLHSQNFLLFLDYSMFFHSPWTCSSYNWNLFFLPLPVNPFFLLALCPQAKRCSPFFSTCWTVYFSLIFQRTKTILNCGISNTWHSSSYSAD